MRVYENRIKIEIITCLPELLRDIFRHSILVRSVSKSIVELNIHDLRDYADNKNRSIDDYCYGGGAGMVLGVEPIVRCIELIKSDGCNWDVVYMSPDGDMLNQLISNAYSTKERLIIICGHYKGIDERVREYFVDREISIGDYVLTGGELPAAVFVDSIVRLIPGVLSDETSALTDSFQDNLLAPPVYTRPTNFRGMIVPSVLLSGNHDRIDEWRYQESIRRTKERRPKLLS